MKLLGIRLCDAEREHGNRKISGTWNCGTGNWVIVFPSTARSWVWSRRSLGSTPIDQSFFFFGTTSNDAFLVSRRQGVIGRFYPRALCFMVRFALPIHEGPALK